MGRKARYQTAAGTGCAKIAARGPGFHTGEEWRAHQAHVVWLHAIVGNRCIERLLLCAIGQRRLAHANLQHAGAQTFLAIRKEADGAELDLRALAHDLGLVGQRRHRHGPQQIDRHARDAHGHARCDLLSHPHHKRRRRAAMLHRLVPRPAGERAYLDVRAVDAEQRFHHSLYKGFGIGMQFVHMGAHHAMRRTVIDDEGAVRDQLRGALSGERQGRRRVGHAMHDERRYFDRFAIRPEVRLHKCLVAGKGRGNSITSQISYRPLNAGVRFCTKASMPSFASSLRISGRSCR